MSVLAMLGNEGSKLLLQLGQVALVVIIAPAVTGLIRRVKARLQRRRGPAILQPYRDLRRLLAKEAVVGETTSWLTRAAPYAVFAATWVAAALVPTFQIRLMFSWSGDVIAIVALLGLARFLQAAAALDAGTAFGGIGASREVMIASLAEPAMIMVVFTLSLVAGSTQLSTMAHTMATAAGLRLSIAMALLGLVIVALAENTRIPIDNPATHLELTMVHEAMLLDYSGRHLAMMELAASLRMVLYLSLIACIFAPFGILTEESSPIALLLALLAYGGKLACACVLLAIFEMATAKMRLFRVPNLLGIALMLGLLGTLLLFVTEGL
ncbi:respiratory chain complex I subunit 1 family protein [Acidisoma sp. 7E03]